MAMPRTVREILDHGDELAARFEAYDPEPGDERDPGVIGELRSAAVARADAERSLQQAVVHAREQRYSWQVIGSLLGTSGEAARQRYRPRQDA